MIKKISNNNSLVYKTIMPLVKKAIGESSLPENEPTSSNFFVGQRVKIVKGQLMYFEGKIQSIDPETGEFNLMVNIFGRDLDVKVNPDEVVPVTEELYRKEEMENKEAEEWEKETEGYGGGM